MLVSSSVCFRVITSDDSKSTFPDELNLSDRMLLMSAWF